MKVNYASERSQRRTFRRQSAAIFAIAFCLTTQSGKAFCQPISCETILRLSYDRHRGLADLSVFPRMRIYINDPLYQYISHDGTAMADKVWRFINRLESSDRIIYSPGFALDVRSIRDLNELPRNKIDYTPVLNLLNIAADLSSAEKRESAAEIYLRRRIENGAKLLTSFSLIVGTGMRAAYISPVLENIDSSQFQRIPHADLAESFFEVFTNLRVDDNELVNSLFKDELARGCLEGKTKNCQILNIGRSIYGHVDELSRYNGTNVIEKVCEYVKLDDGGSP